MKTVYDELLEIASRYKAASDEHRDLRARADDEDSKSLAEDLYRDARRALERFEKIEGELGRWVDEHSDWDYMEHGTLIKAVRELYKKPTDEEIQDAANAGSFPGEAVNEGFVAGAKWVRDGCPER